MPNVPALWRTSSRQRWTFTRATATVTALYAVATGRSIRHGAQAPTRRYVSSAWPRRRLRPRAVSKKGPCGPRSTCCPPRRLCSTRPGRWASMRPRPSRHGGSGRSARSRSEEHTSELQSRENLVCRLLLEKKKKKIKCLVLVNKKKPKNKKQKTTNKH